MDVIGHGFLAQHLAAIAGRHDGVLALAAGVSAAGGTSRSEFDREEALLAGAVLRCRSAGRRLLFFSTASTGMYGATGRGREDEPVRPGTPYGQHKLNLERVVRESTVDHLVVRLGHVVGPNQPPHQLLPSLTSQVMAGRVRLHAGARRDVIDVADVMTVIDLLLAAGVSREVVNIATGHAVPVERLVARIEDRLGRRAHHTVVQTPPVNHLVSIEKLCRLVPPAREMGFTDQYYGPVLDRYLSAGALV